jgi:hypothetical protein
MQVLSALAGDFRLQIKRCRSLFQIYVDLAMWRLATVAPCRNPNIIWKSKSI